MSVIVIRGSGGEYEGKYIKSIDKANSKLEFTNDINKAYERESGFYVNAEIDFLQFHFQEQYPCLEYAKAVSHY